MVYTVVWLKAGTVLATTDFDDLSPAKRHAKEHFPIQNVNLRGSGTPVDSWTSN